MRTGENADIPKQDDINAVIAYLLKSTASTQKILAAMLGELLTLEIKSDTIRPQMENIILTKREPVFNNSVMIGRAGMVRISITLSRACKLLAYVNNSGSYLNQAGELTAECLYVFDVPLNPNDALNIALEFDDADIKTATIKMIRLQEIR